MELFENDCVKIAIDESVPCLEWIGRKGFIPSIEFRLSEERSLELYLKHKAKYPKMEWFVDARYIDAVDPEDTQWMVDEILPQFAEAGLTKEALVIPESALGKITVNHYMSLSGHPIEIRLFQTAEAAKNGQKKVIVQRTNRFTKTGPDYRRCLNGNYLFFVSAIRFFSIS